MEIVYTILIVNFNRHILSFFPDAAIQYSVQQLSSKNLFFYIFSILQNFSVDFGIIIAKTRIEE